MKKVVKLTERDLTRIVKRIIKESNGDELEELKNDIDEMFESLFPKKDGKWTAVWVFNFVDP